MVNLADSTHTTVAGTGVAGLQDGPALSSQIFTGTGMALAVHAPTGDVSAGPGKGNATQSNSSKAGTCPLGSTSWAVRCSRCLQLYFAGGGNSMGCAVRRLAGVGAGNSTVTTVVGECCRLAPRAPRALHLALWPGTGMGRKQRPATLTVPPVRRNHVLRKDQR